MQRGVSVAEGQSVNEYTVTHQSVGVCHLLCVSDMMSSVFHCALAWRSHWTVTTVLFLPQGLEANLLYVIKNQQMVAIVCSVWFGPVKSWEWQWYILILGTLDAKFIQERMPMLVLLIRNQFHKSPSISLKPVVPWHLGYTIHLIYGEPSDGRLGVLWPPHAFTLLTEFHGRTWLQRLCNDRSSQLC